jgi:acyl-CoA thioesterase-2
MVRTDVATEWVLLEIVPDSFQRSIGHGTVRMWAESGELLAVAQQTCIIRTSHHQR